MKKKSLAEVYPEIAKQFHPTKNDKLTVGIREFNSYVHNDRRVENLIIPVGDGLTICRKL